MKILGNFLSTSCSISKALRKSSHVEARTVLSNARDDSSTDVPCHFYKSSVAASMKLSWQSSWKCHKSPRKPMEAYGKQNIQCMQWARLPGVLFIAELAFPREVVERESKLSCRSGRVLANLRPCCPQPLSATGVSSVIDHGSWRKVEDPMEEILLIYNHGTNY